MRRTWPYMVACLHLCKQRALQMASLPLGAWIPLKLSMRSRGLFWLLPKMPLYSRNERGLRILKETNEQGEGGESRGAWNVSFCPLKILGTFQKSALWLKRARIRKCSRKPQTSPSSSWVMNSCLLNLAAHRQMQLTIFILSANV